MTKKYQKKILLFCLFVAFLFISFSYSPRNIISAAGLEVQYPAVAGQTIDAGVQLPDYIKYWFNLGTAIGFIIILVSLAAAGAMYFLSPVSTDLRTAAKDRASGAMTGLLIFVLTYLIITTINPQLSFFSLNSLSPVTVSPAVVKTPGVYFYPEADCSNSRIKPDAVSIPDFDTYRNRIHSVGVDTRTPYISILYDNPNFWGKCLYINGNTSCQAVDPFAASASIYQFDPNPKGDGVYLYRKSYFNQQGGYLFISNNTIKNSGSSDLYVVDLNQLRFTGGIGSNDCNVPEEEQDCVKYDKTQNCTQKSCPTLGGENISSMKINGNYLVLFVYFGPKDNPLGPWTWCQEFPSIDDTNKSGPPQIKWQNIRNVSSGQIPNYMLIIPIQK